MYILFWRAHVAEPPPLLMFSELVSSNRRAGGSNISVSCRARFDEPAAPPAVHPNRFLYKEREQHDQTAVYMLLFLERIDE